MFDWLSFVIGLLLGMIMMLVLIWISYTSRAFVFSYCAVQARPCAGADYYNDPGKALAEDSNISVDDILFLNDQGELFYKRVPYNGSCVPQSNQLIYLRNPEYCLFQGGQTGITAKQIQFGSTMYRDVSSGAVINSAANCQPDPGQSVTTGQVLLRWDPS